jgi:hypothetical protein
MNATANAKPIQSAGALRYFPGVSDTEPILCMLKANASGANPSNRSFSMKAKCQVPNVIFSKKAIASNGNIAQRNVARRATHEISNAQP